MVGQLENSALHHLRLRLERGCKRRLDLEARHPRAIATRSNASFGSAQTYIPPQSNNERTPDSLVELPSILPDRQTRAIKG